MNVPTDRPSRGARIVQERARTVQRYHAQLRDAMEQNRREVEANAEGGGGTAAHVAGTTTRGHTWLLPPDSPLRRPWRHNMVARPSTSAAAASSSAAGGGDLKLSAPLSEQQLDALRRSCAIHPNQLPKDAGECPICYVTLEVPLATNRFAKATCVVLLPCGGGHCFHYKCIEPWLRKGRICPSCRQTVRVSGPPSSPRRKSESTGTNRPFR